METYCAFDGRPLLKTSNEIVTTVIPRTSNSVAVQSTTNVALLSPVSAHSMVHLAVGRGRGARLESKVADEA